jgi:hypothetical protein
MKTSKIRQIAGFAIILTLLFTLNSGCSYAFNGIKGNGNVVKQTRELSSFTALEVGGAFHIVLKQGDKESVVVEADENLIEFIVTEVRGKSLVIKTSEEIHDSKVLNIYLTFKTLDEMEVSGACKLSSEDKLSFSELELECSGASDIILKMTATDLNLDLSGASQINLFGSANTVNLDLSGASDLEAFELEVDKYSADISGASSAEIFVRTELTSDVSGAASLKYKGDPSTATNDVSGAASVKKY